MKHRLPIFLLLISVIASGCVQVSLGTPTDQQSVTVTDVVDGDTVDVRLENGSSRTVRLVGIDTPEIHVENDPEQYEGIPDTAESRECLENWGENASGYVREEIGDEAINLSYKLEDGRPATGSYGRLLGTIHQGNKSINRQLVLQGYARSYSEDGPYIEEEREAKMEIRGLWNCQSRGS